MTGPVEWTASSVVHDGLPGGPTPLGRFAFPRSPGLLRRRRVTTRSATTDPLKRCLSQEVGPGVDQIPPGHRKGAARRRGTDNRGGSRYPIDHFQCSPVGCDGKDLDRCSRPQQGRVGPRTTAVSPVEPTRTAPDNRGGPRPCRGPGRHDFAPPSPRGPAGRNHRIVRGRREHRSSNRPLRDQGAPPPTTTEGDRIQPGPLQTVTFPLPRPILAQWHGFALDLNPGWKRTERRTCTVPYRSISS